MGLLIMRWIFFTLLFFPTLLFAEEKIDPEGLSPKELPTGGLPTGELPMGELSEVFAPSGSFFGEFINMLVTLLFLLLVIFLSLFFLKKLLGRKMKQNMQGKGIKILQRRAINPKVSLYLVDICGKGIVIGDSPGGVHLITEFPEGTDLQALLEEDSPPPSFKEILQKKITSSIFRKKKEI